MPVLAMLIALSVGQSQPVKYPVLEYSPKGYRTAGNVVEGLKSVINWNDPGLAAAIVTPEKDIRLISREGKPGFPVSPWFEEDFHFISGGISLYNGKLSLDFVYDGALPPKGFTLQEFAAPLAAGQRYLVLVSKVNDHGRCQCLGLIPTEMKQLPTSSGARSDFLNGLCECLTEKSEKTFEEALRWFGGYTNVHAIYPNLRSYNEEIPGLKSDAPDLDFQIAKKLEATAADLHEPRSVYVSLLAGQMGAPKLFWPFFALVKNLSKTPKEINPGVLSLTQFGGDWEQLSPSQALALAKPYSGGPLYLFLLSGFVKGDLTKDQLKQVYLNSFTGTQQQQRTILDWIAEEIATIAYHRGDYSSTPDATYPEGFMTRWHWPEGIIDEAGLRHKYDEYFGIKIKP